METLAIGFIDGGETRGSFTHSVANALIKNKNSVPVTHILRTASSNIPANRFAVIQDFLNNTDADWLLFIDSDIVFSPEQIESIWDSRSENRQVISGIYFLLPFQTNVSPVPMPAIFRDDGQELDEGLQVFYHPFPKNQIIEITRAGFGFLLLSRQAIKAVLVATNGSNPFAERWVGERAIGEDFAFFEHLEKAHIKAYAHTGLLLTHEKVIQITYDYYRFFYKHINPMIPGNS